MAKNLPTMQDTRVWSQGWEYPLEKEMATHSSILVWWIPWTEEPGAVQSMGLKRVRHDWVTFTLHWITSEVSAVPKCLEPWNLNIRAVVSLLLLCGMGSGWKHLDSVYRIWLASTAANRRGTGIFPSKCFLPLFLRQRRLSWYPLEMSHMSPWPGLSLMATLKTSST